MRVPRLNVRARSLHIILMAMAMMIAACGADDGGNVRNIGSTGPASASGVASGSGVAAGECNPVNPDLEESAETTVDVRLVDYAFVPSQVDVQAGIVTFEVTNGGTQNHELAFLPGDGEVPFTEEGVPDEEALAQAGAFELEAFGPGQTCNATYNLDPGEYTIFCIVQTDDGTTHYELGMQGTLVVEG